MRDSDVRKAVKNWLGAMHAHEADTRIVEEMGIWSGSVRIDVAVINGELNGFELKSDRDNLSRLPVQADLYGRVFDRLSLVMGARHAEKAHAIIPDWWGVIVATQHDDVVALEPIKEAQQNPTPEAFVIAQLLWREEAIQVLENFGLAKGWKSKRTKLLHERLAAELSIVDLKGHVRRALKQRCNWLTATKSEQAECVD
jgi:hypothetical protein